VIYTLTLESNISFIASGIGRYDYPLRIELTIDSSLNTSNIVHQPSPLSDTFYGFSKSSLIGTSFEFIGHEWDVESLSPIGPGLGTGTEADFYLDTDLISAPPSAIWINFYQDGSSLAWGGAAYTTSDDLVFQNYVSSKYSIIYTHSGSGTYTLTATEIPQSPAIPEPSTVVMLSGLTALGVTLWLRRRAI